MNNMLTGEDIKQLQFLLEKIRNDVRFDTDQKTHALYLLQALKNIDKKDTADNSDDYKCLIL